MKIKAKTDAVRELSVSAEAILSLAVLDLPTYAVAVHASFELPRHLALVADRLEAIERGDLRRLVITMPPRCGKSLLASQILPAWFLGRNPAQHVILALHSQEIADSFGRIVRNTLANPTHQAIFPACRLAPDTSAAHRFSTTQGGSFRSVGKGTAIAGFGCDLLLLDDLVRDSEEAQSETQRQSTWDWLTQVALTRLAPNGRVVAVGTRWHESDVLGRLLAEFGSEWQELRLPALSEGPEVDPLAREANEPLWASRFDRAALESMRRQLGSVAFAALYQANPQPPEGRLFRREWFGSFAEPLPRSEYIRIVLSLDCASKVGTGNDYSAAVVIGERSDGYDVLHAWRDRLEYGALRAAVLQLAQDWRPDEILIEDTSAGTALLQELGERTSLPTIGIRPLSSKLNRAMTTLGTIESGRLRVAENGEWRDDFLDDVCGFPSAAHDDLTDALTQGLRHLVDVAVPGIYVF